MRDYCGVAGKLPELNTGTAYNQTYDPVTNGATWLSPSTVLNPGFARFNVTVDF